TIWLAWMRDNNHTGSTFSAPALVAARLVGGTWSAPETLVAGLPLIDSQSPRVEFSILAVSADSAWITWAAPADQDPFSLDRDLYYAVHSAGGWSSPALLSQLGLAETHPVLVRTSRGGPAVLFTFLNALAALNGSRWDGGSWVSTP